MVDVIDFMTISCHPFVFSQSPAKVSAGLTSVSGLTVTPFDLVYISLSFLWSVFVLGIR